MHKNTIETQVSNDTALRDGLAKNHKQSEKFVIEGKEVTCGALIKLIDGRIEMANASRKAKSDAHDAATAYHTNVDATATTVAALRAQIITRVGKSSGALADYGLSPRKQQTLLTVEERAAVVAKAKATREARHTVGKKQRLLIKGAPPNAAPTATSAQAPATAPPNAVPGRAVTNGAANGAANGVVNGVANGAVNGVANGAVNGVANGVVNGVALATASGTPTS